MRFAALARDLTESPAAYLKAARRINAGEVEGLRPVRVAVLASHTAQLLAPWLVVEGAARGLAIQPWFAPYGQLEQPVLDEHGELYAHQPDAVVLLLRIEDVAAPLAERFLTRSAEEIDAAIASLRARLESLVQALRRHSRATVFISNFPPPMRPSAGLADASLEVSQAAAVQKANAMLAALARQLTDVFIFDQARLVAELGWQRWLDPKLLHMGRIPFGAAGQHATARGLARTLRAALLPSAKCLVLDLDNTLWGGVLGEDGPGGIALGEDFPGNVYKAFQRFLLELKDRGILLAIASKNNEPEARELLATHPDMLLRPADFAAARINWNAKSQNLREIAAELNIGCDALVFFDDNPAEREEVRAHLPQAVVLEPPYDPLGYIGTIEESGVFDRLTLSAEDRGRATLYTDQQARREAEQQFTTKDDFLRSLEMVATIGPVDAAALPRVAQLVTKTNQFNLTTRRHSAAEIEAMMKDGAGLWLRLEDRFGDNGLTGVALAVPEHGGIWRIDTFLLSCRIISRGAETALLARLLAAVRAKGATEVVGEYLSTPKNALCANFYAGHGFAPVGEDRWRLDLATSGVNDPPFITIHAP